MPGLLLSSVCGGKPQTGLVRRRTAEAALWMQPIAGLEQSRVEKDRFDKVHGALEAKVAVLDEWRWKTIGMMLASCFLASGVSGLIGWMITVYYMHK